MPFTFSHPAIILPLNYLPKKWISLTGLVIGSLTPDFEYFLRMKIESNYSHTFWGIFWFDLPLAILLTFIYHNFVKTELFKNLPTELNQRLITAEKLNWNKYFVDNWKIVIASIIVGIVSHIFWDGFTHESGYFVNIFTELRNKVQIFGNEIKILKILQHSSTLIGGLVIAITIYNLPKIENKVHKINVKYWLIILSITFLIITVKILITENVTKIGNIIVSLISAGIIALILTPILIKKKNGS